MVGPIHSLNALGNSITSSVALHLLLLERTSSPFITRSLSTLHGCNHKQLGPGRFSSGRAYADPDKCLLRVGLHHGFLFLGTPWNMRNNLVN